MSQRSFPIQQAGRMDGTAATSASPSAKQSKPRAKATIRERIERELRPAQLRLVKGRPNDAFENLARRRVRPFGSAPLRWIEARDLGTTHQHMKEILYAAMDDALNALFAEEPDRAA